MVVGLVLLLAGPAFGQIVPGTGRRVPHVGDDFEDVRWSFRTAGRKSSQENDGRVRFPKGRSRNGRWDEGTKRGHPDKIERVETPAGGLPGSKGALLLQSMHTGIPGKKTNRQQQDDLMARTFQTSVSNSPNYLVRVYLPPFEEWEKRSGSTFGFRVGARATTQDQVVSHRYGKRIRRSFEPVMLDQVEAYWPGMFIQFLSKEDSERETDAAMLVCRAARTGKEFPGIALTPGWWTLGLSFTPDGAVHYFAAEGVGRLTANDRISSSYPYNFHADTVTTMFFNICSPDDGKTWSTAWIIDDPEMYVGSGRIESDHATVAPQRKVGGFLKGLFR